MQHSNEKGTNHWNPVLYSEIFLTQVLVIALMLHKLMNQKFCILGAWESISAFAMFLYCCLATLSSSCTVERMRSQKGFGSMKYTWHFCLLQNSEKNYRVKHILKLTGNLPDLVDQRFHKAKWNIKPHHTTGDVTIRSQHQRLAKLCKHNLCEILLAGRCLTAKCAGSVR